MTAEKRIKKDIEQLQSELENLVKHIDMGPSNKVTKIAAVAEDAKQFADEKLQQLLAETEDLIKRCRETFNEAEKKVESVVQDHPMTTLFAALGIGIVLGKLLTLGRGSKK